MPIPGIRNRPESFPLIGNIRKGAKKTANAPGPDLDFFRYVPIEGEEAAAELFHQIYKKEPREVAVFLPFGDIEHNFEMFMERHVSSALQCRGDIEGGSAFMWRDTDGRLHHEKKECPLPICTGCKETGRLSVIIPALERYARVVVHTTSIWDILEIYANLQAIKKTEGKLQGIPLILKRRPRMVSTPRGNGKRARKEMWLLSIEVAPRYVRERLEQLHNGDVPRIAATSKTLTVSQEPEWDIIEEEAPPPFAESSEPAEGNGKPDREAYLERYAELWALAQALGIESDELPEDPTVDQIVGAGKSLKGQIVNVKPPSDWKEFAAAAVEYLGFNHANHVTGAWRKIKADPNAAVCNANGQTIEASGGMWTLLKEYQEAKTE